MTDVRNIWFVGKPGCGKTRLMAALRDAGLDGEFRELSLVSGAELGGRSPADVLVIVVSAPDAALAPESEFLAGYRDRVPTVGIATRIDLMPPAREWDPSFENPTSESAQAVVRWADYLTQVLGVKFQLTACEPPDDLPVGIESAKRAITRASGVEHTAPPTKQPEPARLAERRRAGARTVIAAASALAGASQLSSRKVIAAGASFGIQLSMLVALSGLYETPIANPKALLRATLGLILDIGSSHWLRGKGVIPAVVSGAVLTASIGETYLDFLETGKAPQPEAFASAIIENFVNKGT